MINLLGIVERIYRLILRAYPPEYLETFENEMQNTFTEGLEEARLQSNLMSFILREIYDMPKALVNIYWYRWNQKISGGIELLQQATSSSDLPPAPPDGRTSWRQFILETSMFLITGLFMILATYLTFDGLRPGWQRNTELLGNIIVPLTVPFLIIGLVRGLPRWAYPLGGLLLSYSGVIAGQTSLWLFLSIMLLAFAILIIVGILTNPQPTHLPLPLRRIGQSLSIDWTRLSFGIFGAMPLIILMVFDDAYTNGQTPYFSFSVLTMIVGAMVYCKSRDTNIQIVSLLAGLTISILGAWLDIFSFRNSLANWTIVHTSGIESLVWITILWAQWFLFMLSPAAFILFGKVIQLKRAV